jgi:azurin
MRNILFSLIALFAGQQALASCVVDIEAGDGLAFNKEAIEVSSDCETVTVNLTHTGSLPVAAMGHNWVLTATEDYEAVARAGATAGLDNDWLPANDDRIIAATELVGGGGATSVTFSLADLDPEGDYTFFCSFPGHWAVMNGPFRIN